MVTETEGNRAVPGTLPTPPKAWHKAVFGTGISRGTLREVRKIVPMEPACMAVAS